MSILCADKTGTLTQNALTVTTIRPMPGFDEAHVLALAALASSDGGQDPVDGAIRSAAAGKTTSDAPKVIKFVPFDPGTKMSEATVLDPGGGTQRVVKGAFAAVISLIQPSPTATTASEELEEKGFRVLAVAAGPPNAMKLAGLIALSDPPRKDSAALVTELHGLGVRTIMITGDAPATAAIVAHAWGSMAPFVRRDRSPIASAPSNSQSSPASCLRTSTNLSRRSRRTAIPSECAATAPTTRRRCARRKSESRSRRQPMSRNRPPAWC
jgi:magnesium-transporting ATPase (P-type)